MLICLVLLFWLQSAQLCKHVSFHHALETELNRLAEKGLRPSGNHDPQGSVANQTYSLRQLENLSKDLGNSKCHEAARDLSMLLFMHMSAGRSDSIRLVHLADLCPPVHLRHICTPILISSSACLSADISMHACSSALFFALPQLMIIVWLSFSSTCTCMFMRVYFAFQVDCRRHAAPWQKFCKMPQVKDRLAY